jgi:hypothetical protein
VIRKNRRQLVALGPLLNFHCGHTRKPAK